MLIPAREPNETQKLLMQRQFGMFISYGINTFNNTEWSDGTLSPSTYNLKHPDVDQWVRNAYQAGMNYIMILAKHHEGFCLWDTDTTEYSIKNAPNQEDIIRLAADACKKYGVKLGIYYSLWDRHEPCYQNHEAYVEYMLKQIGELTDGRYGEVCELWLDGGWDKKSEDWGLDKLYALVKKNQPHCAFGVNHTIGPYNTAGAPDKSYFPENYRENMPMHYFPSDFRLLDPFATPNNDPKLYTHQGETYYLPFEGTICIRNMNNWFWDPHYTQDPLLTTDFIVKSYHHCVDQQNNLLINLAPNTDGVQELDDVARIFEAAKELGIYRELP